MTQVPVIFLRNDRILRMPVVEDQFDAKKAVAALTYLVREASDNLYILMKMLYVADKKHLSLAGRFMSGDQYVAMEQGAIASGAYDLVKFVRGDHGNHRGCPEVRTIFDVEDRTRLVLKADVPERHLSEAAKACLDEVVALYKAHPHWLYWYRQAHDQAWNESVREDAGAPPITIESVGRAIEENESLMEFLADPYPEAQEG